MEKPLRRIPWCRHYASMVVIILAVMTFLFGCLIKASDCQISEFPNVIGFALGYFMPCSGFFMMLIIILEQLFTRFRAQWVRNTWYYHVAISMLYLLVVIFLRQEDLLRSMDQASEDKLPVAYVLTIIPLLFYFYRVFVPFSFVRYFKSYVEAPQ